MDPLEPWQFFIGKDWGWNIFDFVIVFVSMPGFDTAFGFSADFPMALRLLRLARVLKLLSHHQQLRIILAGLLGGLQSSCYIVLLLMIIYYMFAVAGLMFFQKNDPREFGDFVQTFMTLIRMSTLEDWTDVMYLNVYGCTHYPVGGGVDYWTERSYPNAVDGVDLLHAGQGCSAQSTNLGNIATPEGCATTAAADSTCNGHFMWSPSYNMNWGCRCCAVDGEAGGVANEHWNVYSYATTPDCVGGECERLMGYHVSPNLKVRPYCTHSYLTRMLCTHSYLTRMLFLRSHNRTQYTTQCNENAQFTVTYILVTLFIFVTSLIVLSMFVGSVAISMSTIRQQLEDMNREKRLKLKHRAVDEEVRPWLDVPLWCFD
jgi:hypothetical protein